MLLLLGQNIMRMAQAMAVDAAPLSAALAASGMDHGMAQG
jgi:hypothetical protein